MNYCLVLCTCPEGETAHSLAKALVSEQLAACVNILPHLTSIYTWEGKLENSAESLLLIKTEKSIYPRLEERLKKLHPYEVPEIIALPIERGLPEYLHWVSLCLSNPSSD